MMTESRARAAALGHLGARPRDEKSIPRPPPHCGRTQLATPAVPGKLARFGRIRRWLFRERLWRVDLWRTYARNFSPTAIHRSAKLQRVPSVRLELAIFPMHAS